MWTDILKFLWKPTSERALIVFIHVVWYLNDRDLKEAKDMTESVIWSRKQKAAPGSE